MRVFEILINLFFFYLLILLGNGEIVPVLSWLKNVGNDCRDMANNKDGHIAGAMYAPNASGFRCRS